MWDTRLRVSPLSREASATWELGNDGVIADQECPPGPAFPPPPVAPAPCVGMSRPRHNPFAEKRGML